MTGALAVHYARALADTVFAPGSPVTPVDALGQLNDTVSMISQSEELQRALLSPAVPKRTKLKVISELMGASGASQIIRNFLSVVISHRRLHELTAILRELKLIVDERLGIVSAEITSAKELNAEERSQIEGALREKLGKTIRAEYRVDLQLLGGVRARVASIEYDATLRGKLEALRQRLVSQS
jgi:F-type H+-transporting ATPase subunit delta